MKAKRNKATRRSVDSKGRKIPPSRGPSAAEQRLAAVEHRLEVQAASLDRIERELQALAKARANALASLLDLPARYDPPDRYVLRYKK